MTRDPRSATVLIRELRTLVPDLKVERDDLDGFKVYRTFRFTSATRKGLDDVLAVVADGRIVQNRAITKGVEVTFTHYITADHSDPFQVKKAADLITKPRKPRKRAAKKVSD